MTRILLQYVLPLILPTLVFVGWALLTRRRKAGQVFAWEGGPWFWLILAGVVLLAGVLSYQAITGGSAPGGTYVPPRYEDGRVVPAEVK